MATDKPVTVRVRDRKPHEVALEVTAAGKTDRCVRTFPERRWWAPRREQCREAAWCDADRRMLFLARYDFRAGKFLAPRPDA